MLVGLIVFAAIVSMIFISDPHKPFDFGRLTLALVLCLLWGAVMDIWL